MLEGSRSEQGFGAALKRLPSDPSGAIHELKAQFAADVMKVLLRTQIEADVALLEQRVQMFAQQLAEYMQVETLPKNEQFTFFRRLLNFDKWRVDGKPQSGQFLDYQVVQSNIDAERDHLRVGDHFVRLFTMKEAMAETRPLVLDQLLKISVQLLCRDRMDTRFQRESQKGSQQTAQAFQHVEDWVHLSGHQ